MDNNYWKMLHDSEKDKEKIQEIILAFLCNHMEDKFIFDWIENARDLIEEIYPSIMDETEAYERDISAFIAGMLFVSTNATSGLHGIRWIQALPSEE